MPLKLLEINKIDKQKVGFFRFKQLNDKYLLTNDIGEYCLLNPQEFDAFVSGNIERLYSGVYSELKRKNFIRNQLDLDDLSKRYASKNVYLAQGPSLHIVVVTLRCDHKCLYCQTNSRDIRARESDMDIVTAGKVVDMIFESPNQYITIEFQGGEPLLSWDTVKFIVEYVHKKNKSLNKRLFFSLVSNFTYMSEDKLEFLMNNNIGICTSLDGPERLHNKNRVSINNKISRNSYRNTVKWIRIINKRIQKNRKYKYRINSLTTITKDSLLYSRQIVDEFVRLGLEGVFLRPVNPFGLNKKIWNKISFSANSFLDFYIKALDYIIKLNLNGKEFREETARLFLTKILTDKDPNFLDMRSPCGAGIGQIAYNYNGDVYTCDEGRMLSAISDEAFRLGSVSKNIYKELLNSEIVKSTCLSSCLDNLPGCSDCVYKPYCGVCPVYNYVKEGNIFSANSFNERCVVNRGILDYLFEKLQDGRVRDVFDSWVKEENKRK